MRLCIASIKGGAAKSSVAINLAATLASKRRRIILYDLDPQQATRDYEIPNVEICYGYEASGAITPDAFVIFDTPAGLHPYSQFAIAHATHVLLPVNSDAALDCAIRTEEAIQGFCSRSGHPLPVVRYLLSQWRHNREQRDIETDLMDTVPKQLCKTRIRHSAVLPRLGKTRRVVTQERCKVREDFEALSREILKWRTAK